MRMFKFLYGICSMYYHFIHLNLFYGLYYLRVQPGCGIPLIWNLRAVKEEQKPFLRKIYVDVSKSFRTGRLERELQMVHLSATRCSCVAILGVSLVSFAAITLCVAFQQVFIVVSVYFVIDSVRTLLDTPSYVSQNTTYLLLFGTQLPGNEILHCVAVIKY
jgi:hypothetical protein